MNTHILKVLSQSEAITVQKQDGSTLNKSTIVLQELGGKYEDSYACTLLGQPTPNREQSSSLELPRCEGGKDAKQINAALCKFYPGDLVYAALRFQHSEYQGKFYNEIVVQDIIKVGRE